jgi:hypothetical protein
VAPNVTTKKVTSIEYKDALDNDIQFLSDAWRIVPTDLDADVNSVIDAHVEACSSYEERKERTTIYGAALLTDPTNFNDVYTGVGGYAAAK